MQRAPLLIMVSIAILVTSAGLKAQQANSRSTGREATANRLITFNGMVKDANGLARLGTFGITFALYSTQEGGEVLWRESQIVQTDEEGRYKAFLGSTQKEGLPIDVFSNGAAQWLGIQVQGEEEQPRVLLVAVPYALKAADADTVGGRPLSSFVLYEDLSRIDEKGGGLGIFAPRRSMPRIGIGADSTGMAVSRSSSRNSVRVLGNGGTIGPFNGSESGTSTWYGLNSGHPGLDNNSLFGYNAGNGITSGLGNSIFGADAGKAVASGKNNVLIGIQAGNVTTGDSNVFVGSFAGGANKSGAYNAFFGQQAGYGNMTGDYNSVFGTLAGVNNDANSYNSYFGARSSGASGITNATAIGYQSKVTQSNSLVLGSIDGINNATSDTNVGIGTTNPDRQLVIEGSQAIARFTRFKESNDALAPTFAPAFLFERGRGTRITPVDVSAGDYLGKVQFRGRVSGKMLEYGALAFISTDKNQNGRLAFVDRDLTTERMSILNTGNVGIGTTSPSHKLDVSGDDYVSVRVASGTPNGGQVILQSSAGTWFQYVQNRDLRIYDTADRVTIQTGGNVGIGTTNPTERLQVIGNLKVSGSILYGAPEMEVPDYVFDRNYKLMSIVDLEKFIEQEQHLPNVPKASEIKEKGLNLSEFQMKLLEKIEELTIYTVRQAKTISKKDEEVAALNARLVALEQRMERLTKNESREQK